MTTPTQGEHAQTEALRPKFGDLLRNTMASESNPRRDAYFIREVHRSGGGVNPGRWFEMTDGKGEAWLNSPQNMVPAAPAQPAALAHELFAAAQLAPGEGIEDAVSRIAAALTAAPAQPAAPHGQAPAAGAVAGLADVAALRVKAVQACANANGRDWEFMYSGHQDEQVGAWLDGYSAGQAAPQGAAYAELPESYQSSTLIVGNDGCTVTFHFGTGDEADVESWLSAVTERASHGQAPAEAANWWRKRADEIEVQVAHTGSQEAMSCYTAMRTLLQAATAQAAPAAGAVAGPTRAQIRDVFLANGFTVKEGQTDLKPYVYTAAEALLALAAAPTPAAQADSVLEDAARKAIEKVLALFPFNVPIQKFTINNGPFLTADNDDEFYSVKRVLAFITEIKTTLDAARKQGAKHDNH